MDKQEQTQNVRKSKMPQSILEQTPNAMSHSRTKKKDFEGIIDVAQKINKIINKNRIPKDPHEIIALRDRMQKEEDTFQKARRAKQDIINLRKTWKERREYQREADRLYRRYKIQKAFGVLKKIVRV